MRITPDQLEEVFRHVDHVHPDECCGWLRLADGVVTEVHPARNVADYPGALYEVDDRSLIEANLAYADGAEIVIFHSHPNSSPMPSVIDTSDARHHPAEWRYLIVGRTEFALWSFGPGDHYEQQDIELLDDDRAHA